MEDSGGGVLPSVIAHAVLLLTTCAGALWQYYRDQKNREWTIEDRRQGVAEARAIRMDADRHEAAERAAATQLIIDRAEAQAVALRITTAALAERMQIDTRESTARLALAVESHQTAIEGQVKGAREAADRATTEATQITARITDLNARILASLRAAIPDEDPERGGGK